MHKYILLILSLVTIGCTKASAIVSVDNGYSGKGSGWVAYSNDNNNYSIIMTNYHVCVNNYEEAIFNSATPNFSPTLTIKSEDSDDTKLGYILAYNPIYDLCAIYIDTSLLALDRASRSELTYRQVLFVLSPPPYNPRSGSFIDEDTASNDKWAANHKGGFVIKGNFIRGESGSAVIDAHTKQVVGQLWGCSHNGHLAFITHIEPIIEFLNKVKANLSVLLTSATPKEL